MNQKAHSNYAEAFDAKFGTPCEQVRWQQEKEELVRRLQESERDAARYRWIRNECDGMPPWAETDDAWGGPEHLDDAIDAAMQENTDGKADE